MRTVCWFSAGAASAVATKLALAETPDAIVARILIENEHGDNDRFAEDCGKWFGKLIVPLWSDRYKDCWHVWESRRWLNGPGGALCTVEMKKMVRQAYALPDDINVFGFTVDEKDRAERFKNNNPEITCRFPLIERGLTKADCFLMVKDAGIELPEMYRLGYHNANCIGCVKGGKGYWNKIRRDFPGVFWRMAALEERIGASCINGQPLRTLDPNAGNHKDLELPDCGLFCGENGSSIDNVNEQKEK